MSEKSNRKPIESNETIEFDPQAGLHRVYDTLPYTFHRLQRILQQYDMRMENIWQGYKVNRHYNYHELYRIIRISDGKVIHRRIDLDSMRRFFAKLDIPLEDDHSMSDTALRRNKGAQAFLDAVYKNGR